MSKFKVGDRVMATGTYDGKNLRGKTGTVKSTGFCVGIAFDDDVGGWENSALNIAFGHGWGVDESKLELVYPSSDKIHITTIGNRTIAVHKNGGEVVKRAEAVCCPDDTFSFEYGAKLAMERLFEEEPKEELKFKVGDRVTATDNVGQYANGVGTIKYVDNGVAELGCQVTFDAGMTLWCYTESVRPYTEPEPKEPIAKLYCVEDYKEYFTKGKIYVIEADGYIQFDNHRSNFSYNSVNDFFDHCPSWEKNLAPLISRPAKVGEYVLMDRDDCFHRNKKGDVAKMIDEDFIADPAGGFPNGIYISLGSAYTYVLDGYKPELEYYNGKVVCIDDNDRLSFTVGKLYSVTNGFINGDGCPKYNAYPVKNIDELFTGFGMTFVEYKGEANKEEK